MNFSEFKRVKKDPRIQPLLDEPQAYRKIVFNKSNRSGWTSEVEKTTAYIGYSQSTYPTSCLAHELLHVIIQGEGVRQIRGDVTPDEALRQRVGYLFSHGLNNELQHHKMFPLFIRYGFKSEEFYHDDDPKVREHIEEQLTTIDETVHAITLLFTILAPGGMLIDAERNTYEERLMAADNGKYRERLLEVKSAIHDWSSSDKYDIEDTVRRIFRAAFGDTEIWLAYSDPESFPNDGFFINAPFSV